MLKVNELRIGNLLDNGYNIVQVTSISLDIDDEYAPVIGVCNRLENKNEVIIAEAAFGIEVKPIPLTPEWLERCGFEEKRLLSGADPRFKDPEGIKNYVKGSMIVKWEVDAKKYNAAEFSFAYNQDGLIVYPLSYHPEFLHQLQNLYFALTGEELNIEL